MASISLRSSDSCVVAGSFDFIFFALLQIRSPVCDDAYLILFHRQEVRVQLDSVLQKKIDDPTAQMSAFALSVVELVTKLLDPKSALQ